MALKNEVLCLTLRAFCNDDKTTELLEVLNTGQTITGNTLLREVMHGA